MCKHQFIKIIEIDQGYGGSRISGAIVVCAECGEVRKIWEDGVIEIIKEKKHDTSSDN